MLYISMHEIFKRWKSTILISSIIAVMMFFTIVLISVYENESGFYKNYSNLLSSKGDVIAISDFALRNYGSMGDVEAKLKGVDRIYNNRMIYAQLDNGKKKRPELYIFGLDDVVSDYAPKMIEGQWVDKLTCDEEYVLPVVVPDDSDYSLGEYFEIRNPYDIRNFEDDNPVSLFKLKVVGIFSSESPVCYASNGLDWHINRGLDQFYISKKDLKGTVGSIFYTSKMAIEKADEENKGYNLEVYNNQDFFMIQYKSDISDAEISENRGFLTKIGAYGINSFDETNGYNFEKVRNKLTSFYPIAIAAFTLGIVAIWTMCTITTRESIRSYSVLYIIGMKWKKATVINIIQMFISGMLGALTAFSVFYILKITKKAGAIVFKLGRYQCMACGFIIVAIGVLSALSVIVVLKRHQPVAVLRNTK